MPKDPSPSYDCLKLYGRTNIEPLQDQVDLKFGRTIFYIHGLNAIQRGEETIIPSIRGIRRKPFKIILNHDPLYINLNESKVSSNRRMVEISDVFVGGSGSAACDQKIPRSRTIMTVKSLFKNIILFHACKVRLDEQNQVKLESSEILWIEGSFNQTQEDFEGYFRLNEPKVPMDMPDFYSEFICECGEMPYFLSNCTKPGLLDDFVRDDTDWVLITLVLGLVILIVTFGVGLYCYVKKE